MMSASALTGRPLATGRKLPVGGRALALALILASVAAPAPAQDVTAGRKLAAQQCQTCHGLNGIAQIPIAPNLAGESAIYTQTQLKAFRDGKREHEMMTIVAKELSDQQIADVSAWYEAIKIEATIPE